MTNQEQRVPEINLKEIYLFGFLFLMLILDINLIKNIDILVNKAIIVNTILLPKNRTNNTKEKRIGEQCYDYYGC